MGRDRSSGHRHYAPCCALLLFCGSIALSPGVSEHARKGLGTRGVIPFRDIVVR
ncbi:MAG: hypothetical protein ACP5Q4_04500 [Candidatus Caldatribacteriaceae bacterium]